MDPLTLIVGGVTGLAAAFATHRRYRRSVVQSLVFSTVADPDNVRVRGAHYTWSLDWGMPTSLHLIVKRGGTTAFVEVFSPALCGRDAFRQPSGGDDITVADPARHPQRLRNFDARVMQVAPQSGVLVSALAPLAELDPARVARFVASSARVLRRIEADASMDTLLDCPRCEDTKLDDSGKAPPGTQSCPTCSGALLAAHGAQALFDELGLSPGDVRERQGAQTLECPACHHPMNALVQNDVVIDVCAHCGATWIDGDEAESFLTTMATR